MSPRTSSDPYATTAQRMIDLLLLLFSAAVILVLIYTADHHQRQRKLEQVVRQDSPAFAQK